MCEYCSFELEYTDYFDSETGYMYRGKMALVSHDDYEARIYSLVHKGRAITTVLVTDSEDYDIAGFSVDYCPKCGRRLDIWRGKHDAL